jgi:hypothetical protein
MRGIGTCLRHLVCSLFHFHGLHWQCVCTPRSECALWIQPAICARINAAAFSFALCAGFYVRAFKLYYWPTTQTLQYSLLLAMMDAINHSYLPFERTSMCCTPMYYKHTLSSLMSNSWTTRVALQYSVIMTSTPSVQVKAFCQKFLPARGFYTINLSLPLCKI